MKKATLSRVILGLILVVTLASVQVAPVGSASPIVRYVAPGGACGGAAPCYATIQAAVDAAAAGDVIRVAAGTYTGVQQRNTLRQMVYLDETVTIRGAYTVGEWTISRPHETPTILNAQGQGRVFHISGSVSPVLEGLRITGGDATGLGGGAWPYGGAGGGNGSGVYLYDSAGGVIFKNTILAYHTVGIYASAGSSATVQGILFHGNSSGNITGGGAVTVSNSVSGAPAFAADGFHITAASAAKDKGTNAGGGADIDGHARPRDASYDFGADEYNPWIRLHLPSVVSAMSR